MPRTLFYLMLALNTFLLAACGGIEVRVQNNGPAPLEDVVVRTYQQSYTFGDIPPGKSVVKGIEVLGDSNLSIRHSGTQAWQETDTYVTKGYVGETTLELENGKVVNVIDNLRVGP